MTEIFRNPTNSQQPHQVYRHDGDISKSNQRSTTTSSIQTGRRYFEIQPTVNNHIKYTDMTEIFRNPTNSQQPHQVYRHDGDISKSNQRSTTTSSIQTGRRYFEIQSTVNNHIKYTDRTEIFRNPINGQQPHQVYRQDGDISKSNQRSTTTSSIQTGRRYFEIQSTVNNHIKYTDRTEIFRNPTNGLQPHQVYRQDGDISKSNQRSTTTSSIQTGRRYFEIQPTVNNHIKYTDMTEIFRNPTNGQQPHQVYRR